MGTGGPRGRPPRSSAAPEGASPWKLVPASEPSLLLHLLRLLHYLVELGGADWAAGKAFLSRRQASPPLPSTPAGSASLDQRQLWPGDEGAEGNAGDTDARDMLSGGIRGL